MTRQQTPTTGATDRVAQEIVERIRDGDFVPGQRLVEVSLAEEFGVSRGVIRQCLYKLSAERVVDMELHRGATIHKFSRSELDEVYELREILEGFAARKAAEHKNHKAVAAELEKLVEEMAPSVATEDRGAFSPINARFHEVIIKAADNREISSVLSRLHALLPRMIYGRLLNPGTIRESDAAHRAIVEAIAAGDGRSAGDAMQRHIRKSGDAAKQLPEKYFAKGSG